VVAVTQRSNSVETVILPIRCPRCGLPLEAVCGDWKPGMLRELPFTCPGCDQTAVLPLPARLLKVRRRLGRRLARAE